MKGIALSAVFVMSISIAFAIECSDACISSICTDACDADYPIHVQESDFPYGCAYLTPLCCCAVEETESGSEPAIDDSLPGDGGNISDSQGNASEGNVTDSLPDSNPSDAGLNESEPPADNGTGLFDETSDDETFNNETSGNETLGEGVSNNQTSNNETSGDGTFTGDPGENETSVNETFDQGTGGNETANNQTSDNESLDQGLNDTGNVTGTAGDISPSQGPGSSGGSGGGSGSSSGPSGKAILPDESATDTGTAGGTGKRYISAPPAEEIESEKSPAESLFDMVGFTSNSAEKRPFNIHMLLASVLISVLVIASVRLHRRNPDEIKASLFLESMKKNQDHDKRKEAGK